MNKKKKNKSRAFFANLKDFFLKNEMKEIIKNTKRI